MVPPFPVGIIRKRRNAIINKFIEAGATTPENACSLADLGLRQNNMLKLLQRRQILIEDSPGKYYLDAERNEQFMQFQPWLILIIATALALLFWYFNRG